MNRVKSMMIVTAVVLSVAAGSAYAGEPAVSGFTSVDVMSNYVWRGQKLSNSYVIQPSVGINYGDFAANIWANLDSDPEFLGIDNRFKHTETDLTATYGFSFDKLSFTAGYIYYALESANDTQEVFLSAGYDILLNPTLTVYYDFVEGGGGFAVASIGHSIDITKDIPLNLGASASVNLNDKVMGLDKDGNDFTNFYNGELSASVSVPLTKALSVTPKAAYSLALSNDAKHAISSVSDDGTHDILYGGINLTLSF
ncbi:MAG: hypothetical protein P8013_05115 [Candidatus Sulfobium sp.]|jgi:hypothetical protein